MNKEYKLCAEKENKYYYSETKYILDFFILKPKHDYTFLIMWSECAGEGYHKLIVSFWSVSFQKSIYRYQRIKFFIGKYKSCFLKC